MKFRNYIVSAGLGLALAATSCKKVLDVTPEYALDGSQIFTSLTDYEYSLTGTYSLLRQIGYYGNGATVTGAWSALPDMMADDLVQTNEDFGNFGRLTNYTFTPTDNSLSTAWTAAYSVITQANITLRGIDQYQSANAQKVNRIKGQALALRAMVHFDLLRYWGSDFERNSTGLGVPYVTEVNAFAKPARLSVKETYDRVFADLTTAETLLANVDISINSASSKANIDLNAVRALLARVYLYSKNYGQAEAYATQVITAIPLATAANFANIWKDGSQAEVIFALVYSNVSEGNPNTNVHTASLNRNGYRPTVNFTNLFADKTADVRYSAFVASRSTGSGAAIITDPASTITRKIVNKYIGKGTSADNVVNWKVLRTGEMYLIRAEARAMQQGKEVMALADLNSLRAARISNYTAVNLSGQALMDAILTERRKELFAEGHRWFDLKRTTRTITRTDNTGAFAGLQSALASTSKVWMFPVPQGEIDANPNIRNQQSAGW
ncbi:RagB/SusD family nutrient uptake outer membrane protein [Mucilaginibacter sp. CSA2-8R]|uniref:RagB/SusD family nutrient uptake outer membrane protein n=1 Tax=Mucilaginibacter sp. CSA2-8R TaxID=3141542 RepID=UPI00315D0A77